MNTAYKFRIYPNRKQIGLLAKTFGCVRFIYNRMLTDKMEYYEITGKQLSNTPAQHKDEFPFLKEVDSLALANAQLHLQTAFHNFYQRKDSGFPNFKKKKSRQSYTTNLVNSNISLGGGYHTLPKLGKVRIKQHRAVPEEYRLNRRPNPGDRFFHEGTGNLFGRYKRRISRILPEEQRTACKRAEEIVKV